MHQEQHIITATQSWLRTIIIEYSICPFAKHEWDRGSIRFAIDHSENIENSLEYLMLECERLNSDDRIETTLLIYPNALTEFDSYLDYVAIAEALLTDQSYEGIYQLASFHPWYCFEGAKADDAANYTNRSPYPMLHLLRESSIERAMSLYPDIEHIPQRNIDFTRTLGLAKMKSLLASCLTKPL